MRKLASTITECVTSILRTQDVPDNVDQRHLNTVIVAATIAYRLPLPTGAVHRPEEWFLVNCLAGYEDVAGRLNEYLVMDINEVDKVVRTIWLLRYRILHTPTRRKPCTPCSAPSTTPTTKSPRCTAAGSARWVTTAPPA